MTRCVIAATGPSLAAALPLLRETRIPIIGINRVYQDLPITALMAGNADFWVHYYPTDERLRNGDFEKYTTSSVAAGLYGLCCFQEVDRPGLSRDHTLLHHHHGSGGQAIGLAYHMGFTEIVLAGYDLRFPGGYDGTTRKPGSGRHYFGEYPQKLQHWTRYNIGKAGEIGGLLATYATIKPEDYGIRIINCTPGSALACFETGELEAWI